MIARLTASNRGLSSTAQLAIVVDNNNTHIATDSDNDGIADQFEGSLNASNGAGNANKIQGRVGEDSAFVLETEADLKLRIGTDSRVAGTQQAGLNFNELLSIQPSADVDPLQYENPEQVYDFEISGLSRVGDSVYIVLPHQRTFAEGSVYGKFHPATGWVEFVEDSFNSLSSAKAINDVSGQCPAPHSEAYEPGIQPGHSCLRLWIQDGGPNDADSLDDNGQVREDSGLNGSVADPGAILTPAVDTTPDSVEGTTANTVAGPNTVANPNTVTNPTSATDNTTSAGPFDLAGNVDTTGVVGATDSTVVDFVPQIGAASGTSLAANTVSGSDGGDSVDDTEVAVEEVSETSGAGAFGIWGILLLISVAIRTGLLRRIFQGMPRKRLAMEVGMGTDLQGQDYTKAAIRALKDALWHNSLTVAPALGYPRDAMDVEIEIGVAEPNRVDKAAVASVLPYGQASVTVVKGGLDIPSQDGERLTVMANAAAIVYLDIKEAE